MELSQVWFDVVSPLHSLDQPRCRILLQDVWSCIEWDLLQMKRAFTSPNGRYCLLKRTRMWPQYNKTNSIEKRSRKVHNQQFLNQNVLTEKRRESKSRKKGVNTDKDTTKTEPKLRAATGAHQQTKKKQKQKKNAFPHHFPYILHVFQSTCHGI